jgi:hypothetical protein
VRVTREQAAADYEKNFQRFWDHQLRRVKKQAESASWARVSGATSGGKRSQAKRRSQSTQRARAQRVGKRMDSGEISGSGLKAKA